MIVSRNAFEEFKRLDKARRDSRFAVVSRTLIGSAAGPAQTPEC